MAVPEGFQVKEEAVVLRLSPDSGGGHYGHPMLRQVSVQGQQQAPGMVPWVHLSIWCHLQTPTSPCC